MSFENHHLRQSPRLNHRAYLIEPRRPMGIQSPSFLDHRKLPSDSVFQIDNIAPPTSGVAQHLLSQWHHLQKYCEFVQSTTAEIVTHPLIRYTRKDTPLYSYLIDRSIH